MLTTCGFFVPRPTTGFCLPYIRRVFSDVRKVECLKCIFLRVMYVSLHPAKSSSLDPLHPCSSVHVLICSPLTLTSRHNTLASRYLMLGRLAWHVCLLGEVGYIQSAYYYYYSTAHHLLAHCIATYGCCLLRFASEQEAAYFKVFKES